MNESSSWWIVSDLHLGGEASEACHVDRLLPDFLAHEVAASDSSEQHLVLLGDSFEVNEYVDGDPSQATAVRQLDAVAARYEGVFTALRRCAGSGVTVHVVCGNHDASLARPDVWRRLTELVVGVAPTGLSRDRLILHPWFLYVPGLLYAEHGHQHHELNRFPTLLAARKAGAEGDIRRTPLAAWTHPGAGRLRRARGLAKAMRETGTAERLAAGAEYQALLERAADESGLPVDVARELHDLSQFKPLAVGVNTAHRVVSRRLGTDNRDSYMCSAAGRIHGVLDASGRPVFCYAFGHTHQEALAGVARSRSFYANPGTWCIADREGPDNRKFPFIVVTSREGINRARLGYWRSDKQIREVERLAEANR